MADAGEDRKVAQPGDKMFERNLAILASKGREIRVQTWADEFVGFASGLDEQFLQICQSTDQILTLVSRGAITSITETGYALDSLTDEEAGKKIRERCRQFMQIADNHNSHRQKG